MTIKKSTENLTMKELYDLTRNPETKRMSDHKGKTISVDQYMIREEEKGDTGEVVTIVSIKSGEDIFATNSPTFVREFESLVDMAEKSGATIQHIKVTGGKSRAGREYVTCVYVD